MVQGGFEIEVIIEIQSNHDTLNEIISFVNETTLNILSDPYF